MKEDFAMKKMFKLFAVLLSFMLLIATIAPTAEVIHAATQKKAGTYSVDGYLIKSISKSGNKLKIVTKNSCDMSVLKDENFNYLSRKTYTFVLDKNVYYEMSYYATGDVKKASYNKIKRAVKKSKNYSEEYEAAKEYLPDMTIDDYPCLYILVDKNGKATDIMYTQGKFDWY